MGVIYKFKSDVVNFVLQQKQVNPRLSCRQLAQIVSKEFDLQVSKSSVNSILKSAELSSPVGRRALSSPRQKSFQIPSLKKKEIFGEPSDHREKNQGKTDVATKLKIEDLPSERKVSGVKPAEEVSILKPVGHASAEVKFQVSPSRHSQSTSNLQRHDGLGNIFFKAIEWSLSSRPVLGEILKDYARGFSTEDIDAASKIFLYLRAFGLAGIDDLAHYKGTGLWLLNQLSAGFDFRIVKNLYESLSNLDEIGFRFSNEIDQLFTEISYFKVLCEDGQELAIDAAWESVLGNNVHSVNNVLYNHLLSSLTDQIISPKNPTIIHRAPGQTALAKEFYDLLAIYENRSGKSMAAVSLFDTNGVELSKFSAVPAQARYFIIAVWPWQKEFDFLSSHVSDRHRDELIHPLTGQSAYFAEIGRPALLETTRNISQALRGFLVTLADDHASKAIIMSNIPKEHMPAKQVIDSYWMKWTIWHESEELHPNDSNLGFSTQQFVSSSNFWDNINNFTAKMEQYAYKQFVGHEHSRISLSEFTSICYKTSGYWQDSKDYSVISLIPSDEMTIEKVRILKDAASQFNKFSISDLSGRRVFLKIA